MIISPPLSPPGSKLTLVRPPGRHAHHQLLVLRNLDLDVDHLSLGLDLDHQPLDLNLEYRIPHLHHQCGHYHCRET